MEEKIRNNKSYLNREPQPIEYKNNNVFLFNNIKKIKDDLYEFDLEVLTLQEYLLKERQEKEELHQQILELQEAQAESYEDLEENENDI